MAVKVTVADLVKSRIDSLTKKMVRLDKEYALLANEKYDLEEEYAALKNVKEKIVEKIVHKDREVVSLQVLKGMAKLDAVKALKNGQLSLMDAKKIIEDNNLYTPNQF